jgi:FkbM family methyltransferase
MKRISIFLALLVFLSLGSILGYKYAKGIYTSRHLDSFKRIEVITIQNNSGNLITFDPKDSVISQILFLKGAWEAHITKLFPCIVKPGDKVLCVGAHIGYHAVELAKLIGPEGSLYAIEASPLNFNYLSKNISLNQINNAQLFNNAAFSKEIELSFVTYLGTGANTGHSHVLSDNNNQDKEQESIITKVKGVRIDTLLPLEKVEKIRLIQMDIEGCEIEAIKGAEELIKRSDDLVVIQEWCPKMMEQFSSVEEYLRFWKDLGYSFGNITERKGIQAISEGELLSSQRILDIVITKNLPSLIEQYAQLPK